MIYNNHCISLFSAIESYKGVICVHTLIGSTFRNSASASSH